MRPGCRAAGAPCAGQDVRADLSRELEAEAAFEIGVPGARLYQQVRQARRAEVDQAGCG